MKLKTALLSAILAVPVTAAAQPATMRTDAAGYLARGKQMYENRNYVGAIDQLSHIASLPADKSILDEAEFYLALARFERDETAEGFDAIADRIPTAWYAQEALMRSANNQFYHGRFGEALARYELVREGALNDNANEDLLYRKGYCHLRLGEYAQAEQYYARLKGTKRYADASDFYNAYIDYANGDYEKAMKKFERINRTGELGYQAQYYMCQIYYTRGEYQKAITMAKSLLDDNNNDYFNSEMCRIAGVSYYHEGDDQQARSYIKKYLDTTELEPERTAMYVLGVTDFRMGDYTKTIEDMAAVTSGDDAIAQSALLYTGQAQLKQGKLNEATMAFERAAAMKHDDSVRETAFYNYAVSQAKGGRTPFNSSIEKFEQFLNEYPNSKHTSQVEDYLLDAYLNTSEYDKALESINRIKKPGAKVLKAKQNVLYNLGVQAMSNNKNTTAKKYFEQALAVGNYDKNIVNESRLWLAEAQYRTGDYKNASKNQQRYISSAGKSSDNYALAQYNLGYSLFQQRRYAEAKKAFANALATGKLNKDLQADAHNRVGDSNYYTQDFSAAQESYDQAIAENSSSADYSMYQKALMMGLRKQYTDEVNQLDALIKAYPNSDVLPQAMLEKGNALAANGSNADAAKAYEAVVKSYPKANEARTALIKLAIVQKNMNNEDAAIKTYKRIISTYPTSDEAQAAAEDMKLIYADRGQLDEFSKFLASVPNAPKMDVSEIDRLTFEAAEKQAIASKPSITKMQQYIANNPDGAYVAKAKYYVARYDYQQGKYEAALTGIDEALKAGTDASFAEDAIAIKSEILTKQGKNAEALKAYEQLAEKASTDDNRITAQLGVMRTARSLKKWSTVESTAASLLKAGGLTDAEEKEVTLNSAIAKLNQGNDASAEAELKKLAKDPNSEAGAQAAYELANVQYKAGKVDTAEKTVNSLINAGTPHSYWLAKSFILLADIYHKRGNNYDACQYLESLKANYPGKDKEIFDEIDSRLNKWSSSKSNSKTSTSKTTSKSKKK